MSSILTNNGAMVALQTLKSINSNLESTQGEISTGKSVSTAKDNAAVWAIAKTMEADVKGFAGISDSLSLGQSTVSVARSAAETVTELLTDIKGKVVAAQEENVDRAKIQTDIDALRDQIGAVVGAAQFNGLNLLSNTDKTAGSGQINVLASLDRSSSGVTASDIQVAKQDLGTGAGSINVAAASYTAAASDELSGAANTGAVALANAATPATTTATVGQTSNSGTTAVAAGTGFTVTISAGGGTFATGFDTTTTAGNQEIAYVARDGDTEADVAKGLVDAFNAYVSGNDIAVATGVSASINATNANQIDISGGDTSEGAGTFSVQFASTAVTDTTIGGRLEALGDVDVTTQAGADAALEAIEGLLQTAVDSAAAFGSVQGRIETQSDFISSLTDSLKSGIGTLVDADMEEASARLQALQVQQQLGVQALSIANQAPQSLLSLFR
ncbi:flagellin [Salipiger aestuarii]|uniref:Flagellin n=1 Tax=Salipiger aestuarii TaxID=568098 RepID=A0A327Y0M3_9RHOB|nr:flagellin [Salipiger aestuarii]EIE51601.1 flagellin-like protein [Citreicella sp. 357]KAA8606731.1 flagellin [Salipiger aestuarii]KAA8610588.1 flagellin [Salipiger aestuarii]KAB2541347.1 flagellin [Salipiger aestuarii]RAK13987.1 flagellin [Salipiger aestuarii]